MIATTWAITRSFSWQHANSEEPWNEMDHWKGALDVQEPVTHTLTTAPM